MGMPPKLCVRTAHRQRHRTETPPPPPGPVHRPPPATSPSAHPHVAIRTSPSARPASRLPQSPQRIAACACAPNTLALHAAHAEAHALLVWCMCARECSRFANRTRSVRIIVDFSGGGGLCPEQCTRMAQFGHVDPTIAELFGVLGGHIHWLAAVGIECARDVLLRNDVRVSRDLCLCYLSLFHLLLFLFP